MKQYHPSFGTRECVRTREIPSITDWCWQHVRCTRERLSASTHATAGVGFEGVGSVRTVRPSPRSAWSARRLILGISVQLPECELSVYCVGTAIRWYLEVNPGMVLPGLLAPCDADPSTQSILNNAMCVLPCSYSTTSPERQCSRSRSQFALFNSMRNP